MHSVSPHSNAAHDSNCRHHCKTILTLLTSQFSCRQTLLFVHARYVNMSELATLVSVSTSESHPYALIYERHVQCVTKKYDFCDIDTSIHNKNQF